MSMLFISLLIYSRGHSGHSGHSGHTGHTSHLNYHTSINHRIARTYITSAMIYDIILVKHFYKHEDYGKNNKYDYIYNVTHLYNFTTETRLYRCLYYYKTLNSHNNETIFVASNNIVYLSSPLQNDSKYLHYCLYTYKNIKYLDFVRDILVIILIFIITVMLIGVCSSLSIIHV